MCDVEVPADCEGCGTQVDLLENLYKKVKCVLQSEMPVTRVTDDKLMC